MSVFGNVGLHLLCAPASVCFPHVLRWLDRRNEFEGCVCDAYEADQRSKDLEHDTVAEEDRSGENVDCVCQCLLTSCAKGG